MINPKNICICSCIGFCLSFLIGLFSDVRFANVLFRAFLFALLFAALCIGISFIYQKFLTTDTGGFSVEPEQAAQRPVSGGVVNIVVDDSALPEDAQTPRFEVARHSSSKSFGGDLEPTESENEVKKLDDINEARAAKPAPEPVVRSSPPEQKQAEDAPSRTSSEPAAVREQTSDGGFTPANLGSLTGGAAPAQAQAASPSPQAQPAAGEQKTLDELPDIGEMSLEAASDGGADASPMVETEVISDSEFASGGASFKDTTTQDTSVMAKAIQTILANDNN